MRSRFTIGKWRAASLRHPNQIVDPKGKYKKVLEQNCSLVSAGIGADHLNCRKLNLETTELWLNSKGHHKINCKL